jgi:hypothetical protein
MCCASPASLDGVGAASEWSIEDIVAAAMRCGVGEVEKYTEGLERVPRRAARFASLLMFPFGKGFKHRASDWLLGFRDHSTHFRNCLDR